MENFHNGITNKKNIHSLQVQCIYNTHYKQITHREPPIYTLLKSVKTILHFWMQQGQKQQGKLVIYPARLISFVVKAAYAVYHYVYSTIYTFFVS